MAKEGRLMYSYIRAAVFYFTACKILSVSNKVVCILLFLVTAILQDPQQCNPAAEEHQ